MNEFGMHACIEECNHNRVHVHDHVHVLLTAVQIIMTWRKQKKKVQVCH